MLRTSHAPHATSRFVEWWYLCICDGIFNACVLRRSQLSSSVHEGADGKPYCEEHYLTQFAPKCASCDAPLNGPSLQALGKEWHPDCFVCTHCHKPFPDDAPCLAHENKPYCEVGCMCGHARDTFLNTVPCRRCCCPGGLRGVVWQQVHEV